MNMLDVRDKRIRNENIREIFNMPTIPIIIASLQLLFIGKLSRDPSPKLPSRIGIIEKILANTLQSHHKHITVA